MFKILEKKITGKIGAIKRKEIAPKESGIGILFNNLRNIDIPLYEKLIAEYKSVLAMIGDKELAI